MTTRYLFWSISIFLLCTGALAQTPETCDLSVYFVDQSDGTLMERVLGPEHVETVESATDDITGQTLWVVRLTPEGGAINSSFTESQMGKKIAILCGGEILVSPTVHGKSDVQFAFSLGQSCTNSGLEVVAPDGNTAPHARNTTEPQR